MKKKKLLLLGGLRYLIPVIKKAQAMGIHVITCDYLPDNIAHKYSDEYYNVSITDKDAVLKLAKDLNIDGIMSFAVDPGVVTAGYVCEKMGLPSPGPYESIKILQNKSKFRDFLAKNGFNVPTAKSFKTEKEALEHINIFNWPIIVKPVDSAGSKGVNKVTKKEDLKLAIINALDNSPSKEFIIEEFIEQKGYSSDSDCFSINGNLEFISFSDQFFEKSALNPYTPTGYIWPSSMSDENKIKLSKELQRLFKLLNLKTSIYNIETRIDKYENPYIMEVSPRGGGNRISEILKKATNIDLIEMSIKAALNYKITPPISFKYKKTYAQLVLYSNQNGIFNDINIDSSIKNYTIEEDIWVKKGEKIHSFLGANATLGTLILCFNSREEADEILTSIREKIIIKIK